MQVSNKVLDLTFPKEYQQKFEEYRKRQLESFSKNRRLKKPNSPQIFSSNCKQGIYLSKTIYCCVLKESLERAFCKACPCYEAEPLDYSLFRRE